MGRNDAAIRRCWQEWVDNGRFQRHDVFSDESRFHLYPGDHRRHVWRRPGKRADPAFTTACHMGPQQEVMVRDAISFETGPLWSSLEAHLQHIAYQTRPWPSRSPYSSPIDHAWDMMGRRLHLTGNVHDRSRTGANLARNTLGDHQGALSLYVTSCGAACIQARGGSTSY
ncbi:transposable element Tc1 transposase [Trichonephila clavipes]|nr:transposable element Tc1 transposase [Trichonephila clavipes]